MEKNRRAEMELAMARQFGYEDYASFRQGVAETLGKGMLRQLEKKLEAYGPPAADANAPRATGAQTKGR